MATLSPTARDLKILQLYKILSSLPFSITGHMNLDDKLIKLYEDIADCEFIKSNAYISFLFTAILDIPKNNSDKVYLEKIEAWELNNFKEIFYRSNHEPNSVEAVSFYFYLLSRLRQQKDERLTTSSVLSNFFLERLDFRVGIWDKTRAVARYDDNRRIFEIMIPNNLFNSDAEVQDADDLKIKLNKIWGKGKGSYIKPMLNAEGKSKGRYTLVKLEDHEHYEKTYDYLINGSKIDGIVDNIEEYLLDMEHLALYKKDKFLYKELAYCSICLSFFSKFYDCYIEYILSVARIDEEGQHRNIGGLILGYKNELDDLDRAVFNQTSAHIASVVGGQFLYNESEKYRISELRKKRNRLFRALDDLQFLNALDYTRSYKSFDDLLHNRNNVVYVDEIHKPLKEFLTQHKDYFSLILDGVNPNCHFYKNKFYCLDGSKLEMYKKSDLFLNKIVSSDSGACGLVNIPLLHKLFEIFEENAKEQEMFFKVDEEGYDCIFSNVINKEKEFSKNTLLSRLKNRGVGAKGFLAFIQEFRTALIINGNFYVKVDDKVVFDLELHTRLNNNGQLEFTKEFAEAMDLPSKSFTIIFKILNN